jgi:GrpB-like predicted nucleotidyltransferase (UPF0157 family)
MGWQGPGRLPVQQVPDRLVTRRELAEEMRVGSRTVDRLIADGMPHVRFSPGTVRFRLNQCMTWAEQRYTEKAA